MVALEALAAFGVEGALRVVRLNLPECHLGATGDARTVRRPRRHSQWIASLGRSFTTSLFTSGRTGCF